MAVSRRAPLLIMVTTEADSREPSSCVVMANLGAHTGVWGRLGCEGHRPTVENRQRHPRRYRGTNEGVCGMGGGGGGGGRRWV